MFVEDTTARSLSPEQVDGITAFVTRRYRLLPVSAATKKPLIKRYGSAATSDVALLQRWADMQPGCNFAAVTARQFAIIDVDARHGGVQSFERLERQLGPLPSTPMVMASGGGFHLYFEWTHAAKTAVDLAPGIDVRGEGGNGIIVIPGSVHASGHIYRWAGGCSFDDVALAVLPDPWKRWLQSGGERLSDTVLTSPCGSSDVSSHKAPFRMPHVIDEGARNDTLYRYACSLRGLGEEQGEIMEAVERAGVDRCVPALDADELRAVQDSVARVCAKYPKGFDVGRTRRLLREVEQRVALAPMSRTLQQVLLCHLRVAHAAGSTTYTASVRQIAEASGYTPSTVAAKNLILEQHVLNSHPDPGSTRYKLHVHGLLDALDDRVASTSSPVSNLVELLGSGGNTNVSVLTSCTRYTALVAQELDRHLAFSGHGDLDFATYVTALCQPQRRGELAESLGMNQHTLRGRLRALRRVGMAEVTRGVWRGLPVTQGDLDLVAGDEGWYAKQARRREMFETERRGFAVASRPVDWQGGLTATEEPNIFRFPDNGGGSDTAYASGDHTEYDDDDRDGGVA